MQLERIRALAELMQETELFELELEEEGVRIRLKRGSDAQPTFMPHLMQPPAATPQAAADEEEIDESLHEIVSPMVGTFYRAPSPESDPYVEVGGKIEVGTVLCIIEAMKVMNEIRAEVEGEVAEILVANGEAVEYDQPIFRIRV